MTTGARIDTFDDLRGLFAERSSVVVIDGSLRLSAADGGGGGLLGGPGGGGAACLGGGGGGGRDFGGGGLAPEGGPFGGGGLFIVWAIAIFLCWSPGGAEFVDTVDAILTKVFKIRK